MGKSASFDTRNFDNIDYIVQLPLIDNPKKRQSRFLLAMDYTLSPRDELGVMDTALEHIMHYYDMSKVELIFVEMWQSVCLLIEFDDVLKCTKAYNQLFQFFKTIFYVCNLCELEELWICSHCQQQNVISNKAINNQINHKRTTQNGTDYIYYCHQCKNMNHASIKKIKYSYRQKQKLCAKSQQSKFLSSTSSIAAQYEMLQNDKNEAVHTPHGHNMMIGHAHGPLKFNLPQHSASKSMNDMDHIGHNLHAKNESIDSVEALSVCTSSTAVSSIDANLDLVCTILENIEHETSVSLMCEDESKKIMQLKQMQIRAKLVKMKQYLANIEPNIDRLFGHQKEQQNDDDDDVVVIDDDKIYKNHLLTKKNLKLLDSDYGHCNVEGDEDEYKESDEEYQSVLCQTKSGQSLLGIANGRIKFKYDNEYDYD